MPVCQIAPVGKDCGSEKMHIMDRMDDSAQKRRTGDIFARKFFLKRGHTVHFKSQSEAVISEVWIFRGAGPWRRKHRRPFPDEGLQVSVEIGTHSDRSLCRIMFPYHFSYNIASEREKTRFPHSILRETAEREFRIVPPDSSGCFLLSVTLHDTGGPERNIQRISGGIF